MPMPCCKTAAEGFEHCSTTGIPACSRISPQYSARPPRPARYSIATCNRTGCRNIGWYIGSYRMPPVAAGCCRMLLKLFSEEPHPRVPGSPEMSPPLYRARCDGEGETPSSPAVGRMAAQAACTGGSKGRRPDDRARIDRARRPRPLLGGVLHLFTGRVKKRASGVRRFRAARARPPAPRCRRDTRAGDRVTDPAACPIRREPAG